MHNPELVSITNLVRVSKVNAKPLPVIVLWFLFIQDNKLLILLSLVYSVPWLVLVGVWSHMFRKHWPQIRWNRIRMINMSKSMTQQDIGTNIYIIFKRNPNFTDFNSFKAVIRRKVTRCLESWKSLQLKQEIDSARNIVQSYSFEHMLQCLYLNKQPHGSIGKSLLAEIKVRIQNFFIH